MPILIRIYLLLSILLLNCNNDNKAEGHKKPNPEKLDPAKKDWRKFHAAVDSLCGVLPVFLKENKFNEQWVLVAHLGIHSGLPRMAFVNIKTKTFADSGCVFHGYGAEAFSEKAIFSNTPNSYCSSKGRYKIGKKYNGSFGTSYKLHGLDKTNKNAYARFIVLRSYYMVPEKAAYPAFIMNSQGCPMVSPQYLYRLSKYIDTSERPILLWIID
jgi:hypothetical protein